VDINNFGAAEAARSSRVEKRGFCRAANEIQKGK
jgi:hypothetical protein